MKICQNSMVSSETSGSMPAPSLLSAVSLSMDDKINGGLELSKEKEILLNLCNKLCVNEAAI